MLKEIVKVHGLFFKGKKKKTTELHLSSLLNTANNHSHCIYLFIRLTNNQLQIYYNILLF